MALQWENEKIPVQQGIHSGPGMMRFFKYCARAAVQGPVSSFIFSLSSDDCISGPFISAAIMP